MPASTIVTFRRWTEKDSDLAFSLWGDPRVDPNGTRETAIARLHSEMQHEHDFKVQCWATFVCDSTGSPPPAFFNVATGQRLLGAVGLRRCENGVFALQMELSPYYAWRNPHGVLWGMNQTFSRELILQVAEHAFGTLKLEAIECGHQISDTNAGKILMKLGFLLSSDASESVHATFKHYILTASRWNEQRMSRLGIASPPSSLLHGLPEGKLFATHSSSQSAYGEWGWMCLANSVVGLRLCTSPPCGNGLKYASGAYMIEYLGTAEDLPAPEHVVEHLRVCACVMIRCKTDVTPEKSDDGLQISLLRLSRGRLAVHYHEPSPPLSVGAVGSWCLVRATFRRREFFFLPNVMRDRLVVDAEHGLLAEPEEVGWLLAMNVLQDVESCHHVATTPSRISWWMRQQYRLFF